jgi:hypothetical protein
MMQIGNAMRVHGVSVRSMRYTEEGDRWIPIITQDGWDLQNIETGESVPLCDWLALLTRQMREDGTMGEHTTTTVNKVIITVPQRGENVDMAPNSSEYKDYLAACRFDNGEFANGLYADTGKKVCKTVLAAACRGKRISPTGTKSELLGRLACTRIKSAAAMKPSVLKRALTEVVAHSNSEGKKHKKGSAAASTA